MKGSLEIVNNFYGVKIPRSLALLKNKSTNMNKVKIFFEVIDSYGEGIKSIQKSIDKLSL